MTTIVTVLAIALGVVSLIGIGLLPRIFFRRGRLNLQWWLNSVPFWTAGAVLLAVLAGLVSPYRPPPRLELILPAMSIVSSVAALALLAATLATHRRPLALWHQVDDAPEHLVTGGPYAWVRHPFYASFALTLASCALAAPHWATILALTYGTHRLHATARREEARFLGSPLGGRYAEYMRRTGCLVPRFGWKRRAPSAEPDAGPRDEASEALQEQGSEQRQLATPSLTGEAKRAVHRP